MTRFALTLILTACAAPVAAAPAAPSAPIEDGGAGDPCTEYDDGTSSCALGYACHPESFVCVEACGDDGVCGDNEVCVEHEVYPDNEDLEVEIWRSCEPKE